MVINVINYQVASIQKKTDHLQNYSYQYATYCKQVSSTCHKANQLTVGSQIIYAVQSSGVKKRK